MPKVAGKHYPYTKSGKQQAARARSRIQTAAMKKSAKRITKKRAWQRNGRVESITTKIIRVKPSPSPNLRNHAF